MKRAIISAACLVMAVSAMACTNLIVGKKASRDGSVICSYNCDAFGFAGYLFYNPPGYGIANPNHDPGLDIDMSLDKKGWLKGRTYNVVGMMNENQVTVVETTFDGRLELVNEEGKLDYYTMMQLALQHSRTAREAIRCMTDLVEEYGYNSSGETITVCDKEEAWIMEMIGKGPGRNGAVWVALRIPDDCICAHANISRIRQFPRKDKENCMYSKDVISFAREKGFFSGKDEDFSFRDAYCPIDFENVRYADARVYSFFRHHVADKAEIDKYLPYINGDFDKCDHLPLWIKPDTLVDVQGIMNDMRDHFEGTALDMTADVSAGPWGMPVRPMPMTFKDTEGNAMFCERPIATQKSAFTMVCQMRSWMNDEVGGITFFNCDDADMVAYVPLYCCIREVPYAFRRENTPQDQYNEHSAFWLNNIVANMIYPRYSMMIGDLREAQKELEDYYLTSQDTIVKTVSAMEDKEERVRYLTEKSAAYTDMMMKRWTTLFNTLIVKYNDLVVFPSKDGKRISGQPYSAPGYNQHFIDDISKTTGDRYRMRQLIERRER